MQDIVDDPIYCSLQGMSIHCSPNDPPRDADCSICTEPFQEGEHLIRHDRDAGRSVTGCGQSYHPACALRWLNDHCKCPYCRQCLKGHPGDSCDMLTEDGEVDIELAEMAIEMEDLDRSLSRMRSGIHLVGQTQACLNELTTNVFERLADPTVSEEILLEELDAIDLLIRAARGTFRMARIGISREGGEAVRAQITAEVDYADLSSDDDDVDSTS